MKRSILVLCALLSVSAFADGWGRRGHIQPAARKLAQKADRLKQIVQANQSLGFSNLDRQVNQLEEATDRFQQAVHGGGMDYDGARRAFWDLVRQYNDVKREFHSGLGGRNDENRRWRRGGGRGWGDGRRDRDNDDENFDDDELYSELMTSWAEFVDAFQDLKRIMRERPRHVPPPARDVTVTVSGTKDFEGHSSGMDKARREALDNCQKYPLVQLACATVSTTMDLRFKYRSIARGTAAFSATAAREDLARSNAIAQCQGKGLICQ